MEECGLNLAGSGWGKVVACSEHCDERLGSVKYVPDLE